MVRRRRRHRTMTPAALAASKRNLAKARAARSRQAKKRNEVMAKFPEQFPGQKPRATSKKQSSMTARERRVHQELFGTPAKKSVRPQRVSRTAAAKTVAKARGSHTGVSMPFGKYTKFHPYGGGAYDIRKTGGKELPLIGKAGADYALTHRGKLPPLKPKRRTGRRVRR